MSRGGHLGVHYLWLEGWGRQPRLELKGESRQREQHGKAPAGDMIGFTNEQEGGECGWIEQVVTEKALEGTAVGWGQNTEHCWFWGNGCWI